MAEGARREDEGSEERRRMMEQAEKMDPNNTITGDDPEDAG